MRGKSATYDLPEPILLFAPRPKAVANSNDKEGHGDQDKCDLRKRIDNQLSIVRIGSVAHILAQSVRPAAMCSKAACRKRLPQGHVVRGNVELERLLFPDSRRSFSLPVPVAERPRLCKNTTRVFASAAKQSPNSEWLSTRLLRRCAPRNDGARGDCFVAALLVMTGRGEIASSLRSS